MSGVPGESGRKPLPKATKELAGTYRADQHNPNEPNLPALENTPRCPAHLNGEAKKAWHRTGKVLVSMGVLTEADLNGLEAYCSVYGRWKDAEAHLGQAGLTTLGGQTGMVVVPSPYLKIVEDSLKQMKGWMVEFGLTPSSRSRVKVEKREPLKSDGEDWFNDHRN